MYSIRLRALSAALLLLVPVVSFAQESQRSDGAPAAAEAAPAFAISAWSIEGNTLLPDEDLQNVLAPYSRPDATFVSLQEAIKAIESAYQSAGYSAVRVVLPEQDIEDQRVRLRVIEATLGRVFVEGNRYFEPETIKASVPALRPGTVPNIRTVSNELQVVNDGPARQQTVVLKKGIGPTDVDAVIRVADADPLRVAVIADNTGSDATGKFRLGLVVQHANVFDLDHVGSAQIITSPDHVDKVAIVGLGYRIPIYQSNSSIDLIAGYSDVDSGSVSTAGGSLNIAGRGFTYSLHYNQYLPRMADWLQKFYFGFDYKLFDNTAVDSQSGQDFTPDVEVVPLSMGYSISGRWNDIDLTANLSQSHGSPVDVEQGGAVAYSSYTVWRYGFSISTPLESFVWKLDFNGQDTDDHLISGEQFGIGGADSVRGFEERSVANDRGNRYSMSLTSPEVGSELGVEGLLFRVLAFFDGGQVKRNHAQPGEIVRESIASVGYGIRGSFGRQMSFRADYGYVTRPGGNESSRDGRLHASLTYLF